MTSEDFFRKICTSHFICNVCVWEGVGDRTELQYIEPHSYGHQRCVFLVLQMLNRRPGSLHCGLSLLHLITNWSGPQTPSGVPRAPFAGWWLSLPLLSPTRLIFNSWLSVSPSYIIVKSPTQSPTLNLWNSMFDRHQAEITVMQFTGHSLPVHQSMSVPWDFLSCPISSAKPAYAISSHNCHRNVSLPSGASLWDGMFGRVEGQYTTLSFHLLFLLLVSTEVLGFCPSSFDVELSRFDLSLEGLWRVWIIISGEVEWPTS